MKPEHRGIGLTSQRARDRLVNQLREQGIQSPEVLELIRSIPRHLFVDEALASRAYENSALPIGYGQTISQPYIVARMTALLLASGPMDQVLEVGGGCGYQSAILSRLARRVYSVERIAALAKRLRERLAALNYVNVWVKHGDGSRGWPEAAPYDAILVAAAAPVLPVAVREQLRIGGRLVMPVGNPHDQYLWRVTRQKEGYTEECYDRVSFVPMLEGVT